VNDGKSLTGPKKSKRDSTELVSDQEIRGSQVGNHEKEEGGIPLRPHGGADLIASPADEEEEQILPDNFGPLSRQLEDASPPRDFGHSFPGRSAREIARQFGIELSESDADEEVDPGELAEALRMAGDL
jgi:hypothetical protein